MQKLTVGLIGNPNSGKTTLFNQLTGARQRVGNWAGEKPVIFHALSGVNCIGPTCLSLTEEEFSGRLEAVAPGTVANEKRKNVL